MIAEMIKWVDIASGEVGWQENKDFPPQPILSVGFVVTETPTYIVLCQSMYDEVNPDYYDNMISIPRGVIVNRKQLVEK